MTPTFDGFRASTQRSIERIGEKLPHDGEWAATILMECPPDTLAILPIGGHETNSATDLAWVTAAITSAHARRVARIQGVEVRGEDRELITLHVAEPGRSEVFVAEVTRRPDEPPRLGEWQGAAAAGPTADSLRLAVAGAQQN